MFAPFGISQLGCVCALEQGKALPEDTAGFFSYRHPDNILIHPSGEALGAIGNPDVLDILKRYSQDPVIEVRFLRGHFLWDAAPLVSEYKAGPAWAGGWGHHGDILLRAGVLLALSSAVLQPGPCPCPHRWQRRVSWP